MEKIGLSRHFLGLVEVYANHFNLHLFRMYNHLTYNLNQSKSLNNFKGVVHTVKRLEQIDTMLRPCKQHI